MMYIVILLGALGVNSDKYIGKGCGNLFDQNCIRRLANHKLGHWEPPNGSPRRRCTNLFDESCVNGVLPNSAKDESWLNNGSPGKRCTNLFDESCINGALPDSAKDESWLNNGSPGKRCTNLFDESCINGALSDSAKDESWLNYGSPGKRCTNLFDDSCINLGILNSEKDKSLINSGFPRRRITEHKGQLQKNLLPHLIYQAYSDNKRCANLFDESCINGGVVGSSDDEKWLNVGSPGKRCVPGECE